MSAPNTFGGEEDEPPTREESPPTTPGAVVDLAFMRGSNNFKASYTAELDNYPTRWVRPHAPRVGGPAPVCVPPTQALLRKRAMFQAGWNLLEEESWDVREPRQLRQRALVCPLTNRKAVHVDSTDVWQRRTRLQIALQIESKLELWLESIGRGSEGGARPSPSHARQELVAAQASGEPHRVWAWDSSYWWSTPTNHDALSEAELESGYDLDSRSCAGE